MSHRAITDGIWTQMTDDTSDAVEFDDLIALSLAQLAGGGDGPRPEVRERLLLRIREESPSIPAGFTFRLAARDKWLPHPVPGIRMRVLAMNRAQGYAILLLNAAPGARFPPHHHTGDEECYVISGSLFTCGRRIGPGDFLHADADSDHGELWTDEGCEVLLVVRPEDYMPDAPR